MKIRLIRPIRHIRPIFFLLSALLAAGMGIFFFAYFSKPASAAWFSDSWAFRKAIPVTNNTSAENNVYISVTVDTSSTTNFQAHCEDVRFTNSGGDLLSTYLFTDLCRSGSSVFHVFLDTFPAGAQTIYVYYGNPSAPNTFAAADFATVASNYTVGTLAAQEAAPGPVLYFAFDEGQGTSANDASTNANTGTLGGTTVPTWQIENQCIFGKCLFFDGSTSKVTGSKVALGIQTVSFWIRPNTIASQGLIDLDGGTHKINTNASGVISAAGFTSPTYYINGVATATPTLVLNQWNYVTITTGTSFNSTATFTIGTDGTNFIKGFIDDVKFYASAKTSAQVKANYASKGSVKGVSARFGGGDQDYLSNGLIGYWKMDESSANTCTGASNDACDSSGNGSDGAWNGDAANTTGKFNNGTTYDGTGDYVKVTQNSTINIGADFSYSFWVKTTQSLGGVYYAGAWIIDKDISGCASDYWITSFSGKIRFLTDDGSQCGLYIDSTTSINNGNWHHVAVTRKQSTGRKEIYIDGVLENNQTGATNSVSNTEDLYFGSGDNGAANFFNGQLDEMRLYNRVLSAKEVRDLYNWAPGPRAELKMEEGAGTTTYDTSGNGRNGTINGNPTWSNGKYGKGLKMDGTGDNISVPDF